MTQTNQIPDGIYFVNGRISALDDIRTAMAESGGRSVEHGEAWGPFQSDDHASCRFNNWVDDHFGREPEMVTVIDNQIV